MLDYIIPSSAPSVDDILSRWGLPTASGGSLPAPPASYSPKGNLWDPNNTNPPGFGNSPNTAAAAGMPVPSSASADQPITASDGNTVLPRAPRGMFGNPGAAGISQNLPDAQLNLPTPNVPAYHPHFFEKGGLGGKILNGVSEFALAYSASQGDPYAMAVVQNRMQMQRQAAEDQRETRRQLLLAQAKRALPQIFNSGDGQILAVDPTSMSVSELHSARPQQPKVSEQQSLIEFWNSLPPNDPRRPMVERAIRGYQYTAPVMEQRQQNQMQMEDHRQEHRMDLRTTPTYSNLHPRTGSGGKTGGAAGYEYRVVNGKLMRRKV